jgi:hypothetical protein
LSYIQTLDSFYIPAVRHPVSALIKLMKNRYYTGVTIGALLSWLTMFLTASWVHADFPPGGQIIEPGYHHLGSNESDQQWPEVSKKPDALRLNVSFESKANPTDWVVAIRQRDVTERTLLLLNGKALGALHLNDAPETFYYPIPAGGLKDGENRLKVSPTRPRDNIVIGPIHLYQQPIRELQQLSRITISVHDASTGGPVPARITITDRNGNPVEFFGAKSSHTAVRLGILYTLGTPTSFELRPGDYMIYATRGMEWSRAEAALSVTKGRPTEANLTIRREVDTTGFVAADTHIHTLTHSGHGDSNMEERVLTLAGEGVELAIATDHNHNTDYTPQQQQLGLQEFFTAVTGNEVSTPVGHFNGFPLDPKEAPPAHKLKDWVLLVDDIRSKGAKVVILNHPRGINFARYAFNLFPVNRATGEFTNTAHFPFDAMEITNPGGAFDPIYLLQDWFALLNYGHKVTAVSASDSHTVGDPVGWWRSYVPSATDDPAKIDVDDACERYLRGETSASLGIFADIRVDEHYTMGQTHSPKEPEVKIKFRVAAPSWVRPRRAIVFLNGQQVAEKPVPVKEGKATDLWMELSVKVPKHDAHLICAVIGDGINHPTLSSKDKNSAFTYAVTNPVFLDSDGDGRYSSPRESAGILLSRAGTTLDEQWQAIMRAEDVIAIQMASLLRQQIAPELRGELDQRIRAAARQHKLFLEYVQQALPSEAQTEPAGAQ